MNTTSGMLAIGGICALASQGALAEESQSKPNIIFIEVDDLPAHYVGALGASFGQTPTIDKLIAEGVYFTNAVCQGTMCGPSRNSLIIGQYPHNLGFYENRTFNGLAAGVWTLPGSLKRAGYQTAYIGKSHIHSSEEGLVGGRAKVRTEGHRRLGFDTVWQSMGRGVVSKKTAKTGDDSYVDLLLKGGDFAKMKAEIGKPTTLPDDVYLDGLFTKMATEYIDKHKVDKKPIFLWLNYSVPHAPFDVKKSYHDRFAKTKMPNPNTIDDKGKNIPSGLRPKKLKSDKELVKHQRGNCANIAFLDDQVKAVIKSVDESGRSDNTIIVFFSDHGILIGDHGLMHKGTLYKEVLNPTLVIYDLRSPGKKMVSQPVELLDLVKTTLDWAGASQKDREKPYGESLVPLLKGNNKAYKREFAVGECPGYYAMVTQEYKYIAPFDYNQDADKAIVLFDLKADPNETQNVASKHPEVVARFAKAAKLWFKANGAAKPPARARPRKGKKGIKKH